MTQELLSGFAGIARSHLSMIENGTKQANVDTLWRIAQALDIKPILSLLFGYPDSGYYCYTILVSSCQEVMICND